MFSFKCDINVILEMFALEEQFIYLANVLSFIQNTSKSFYFYFKNECVNNDVWFGEWCIYVLTDFDCPI